MDFKRRNLLLSVNELHFTHAHYMKPAQAFLLRALLILPRPNVGSREMLRILESAEQGELIGEKAGFHEKTLFKQSVEGPFSIGLQLSEAISENSFATILGEIASSTVESAGSLLSAGAIPILRSGIRSSARFFAGKLNEKDPAIIAEGFHQVTRVTNHTLTLTLSAAGTLKTSAGTRGPKGRRKRPVKVILREGDGVATARIQLKYFS